MSKERNLAAVAFLCGVLSAAGWALYLQVFRGVFGEGWMVFFNAARLYFEGRIDLLYDGVRSTALLNARFEGWLAHPLPLHPWLYPPHALVPLLPFGLLPFAAAGGLFLAAGCAAMLGAARCFARSGREWVIFAASLALCPAAAMTVCLGQNTFFTCALLIAGFGTLRRRPLLAGALLGIATFKPQLWLMVPVALIAGRHWKALLAAAASAAAMAAVSVALFGLEPWRAWLALMVEPNALYDAWQAIARINGQSVYTYARLLGAPAPLADLVQAQPAASGGAIAGRWPTTCASPCCSPPRRWPRRTSSTTTPCCWARRQACSSCAATATDSVPATSRSPFCSGRALSSIRRPSLRSASRRRRSSRFSSPSQCCAAVRPSSAGRRTPSSIPPEAVAPQRTVRMAIALMEYCGMPSTSCPLTVLSCVITMAVAPTPAARSLSCSTRLSSVAAEPPCATTTPSWM